VSLSVQLVHMVTISIGHAFQIAQFLSVATNSIFPIFVSLNAQVLISLTFQLEHALLTAGLDFMEKQPPAFVRVVILVVLLAYRNLNVLPALRGFIFHLEPV